MLKMMVSPWRDATPYLGIGSYYLGTGSERDPQGEELVDVTLEAPLIINGRQVRMLIEKYGTDSSDQMTAMAGAWTLRREILRMGHDGIIAVGSRLNDGRLTLVRLDRSADKPHSTTPTGRGKNAGAQISRLAIAELAPAY